MLWKIVLFAITVVFWSMVWWKTLSSMKSSTMPQTLVEFLDITILPCHSCYGTHLWILFFIILFKCYVLFLLVMLTISVALALLIVTMLVCYGIHLWIPLFCLFVQMLHSLLTCDARLGFLYINHMGKKWFFMWGF